MTTITQNDTTANFKKAASRLIRKIDIRIIPYIAMLKLFMFGSHYTMGFTRLTHFRSDLNLSSEEDSLSVSAYYVGYLIFAVPSTIVPRFIGLTRYIVLCMILWGIFTCSIAFVVNGKQVIALRCVLGVIESGNFACIMIYISLWYRRRDQIMRLAVFLGASYVFGAFAEFLFYIINKMDGVEGLKNWQWFDLLTGLPIIPFGIVNYFCFGTVPETVHWLSNIEKDFLTEILRTDAGMANTEPQSNSRLSWRQVRYVFMDLKIYRYCMIYLGSVGILRCFPIIIPLLLNNFSFTQSPIELFMIGIYIIAIVSCFSGSYSAFRCYEHGFHITGFLFVALLGYVFLASLSEISSTAGYVGLCMATFGLCGASPILLAWSTNNVGGHVKRAVAIGCFIAISQLGGIVVTQFYRDANKSIIQRGHIISGGAVTFALITTCIQRACLKKENNRRNHLSPVEHEREKNVEEPCDLHPDFRYAL
ncbi:unnamed protein product [Rotaria magnacalcarata]|uniref:Major facilitator superfamily (MFS) profile domain-containing protein n=2 Tax=Rotaria magnacalcarata TaxID=392030 RepID=A0A816QS70_9BILA|nr:unnamed protein product [Rotaria magnacalcarata]